MERGDVIVVSAASGSGKTTICRRLVDRVEGMELSVSCTTRPRKAGERDGVDYRFVSPETFDRMLISNEFLEHATVYGNRYGTPRKTVESIVSRGKDAVLEIDVQGGRRVKEALPEAVLVAVFPPDTETLARRLSGRGRDTGEEMRTRLDAARAEMRELLGYDYLVINDDLEVALAEIEAIVRARRLRRERAAARVRAVLGESGEGTPWPE